MIAFCLSCFCAAQVALQQQILTNQNLAEVRKASALLKRMPGLVGYLQSMVRILGAHGKHDSDTPVDELVFDDDQDSLRVPGGIVETLTTQVNAMLASKGLEASKSTIWRMFKMANITFRKVT